VNAADPPDDIEDDGTLPTEQPTVDAANVTTHARQQTKAIVRREKIRQFWSTALRDPIGAEVLWQLLIDLHTFEERFACGPNGFPQPEATWFAAGEQAVGLRLYRTFGNFDREALFALHDRFDPNFVKPKPPPKKRDES
jgi:hypothetical protein